MTEQDIKEFAEALAHEYARVRQEWYDAIKIAAFIKDKAQASWDQMHRVCETMLPQEIKEEFDKALTHIELRGKSNEGNERN